MRPIYLPRDFIETSEGFIFAVVDTCPEDGRVLCFLRYVRRDGRLRKLGTAAAQASLAAHAPAYLFTSKRLEASLHGVPTERIRRHYQPRERVRELLATSARDAIEAKAARWLRLMADHGLDLARLGLTGSLLLGAQTAASDLDFVIYGREAFFQARRLVHALIEAGELANLDEAAWREAYDRRGCALSFEEYLWHERRKFNKGLIDGTKFDITLTGEDAPHDVEPVRKLGRTTLRAVVDDARHAYDHPAAYRLDHPDITEALSFTHTYAGQAEAGERIEIAGIVEETAAGQRRLVVGSSREAPGEYIRVLNLVEAGK
ncbi:nucleotidyltransferase domain-containing protein [Methylomagnum sp.]